MTKFLIVYGYIFEGDFTLVQKFFVKIMQKEIIKYACNKPCYKKNIDRYF